MGRLRRGPLEKRGGLRRDDGGMIFYQLHGDLGTRCHITIIADALFARAVCPTAPRGVGERTGVDTDLDPCCTPRAR